MMEQKFSNEFINNYVKEHNLNIIGYDEDRPWGGYYIYEEGDNYDKKVFFIKPGQFLSLQYHGTEDHPGHNEQWTALTEMKVVLGNKSAVGLSEEETKDELNNLNIIKLQPNESIKIPAGYMHALVNPYPHMVHFIETRTSDHNENPSDREENIVRVYDQSQRGGTPPWPKELIEKIYNT